MERHFSIKFFVRTDQKLHSGKLPIYVRVILHGEKYDFTTGQYIYDIEDWDEDSQRVRKKSPINNALSDVERDGYFTQTDHLFLLAVDHPKQT